MQVYFYHNKYDRRFVDKKLKIDDYIWHIGNAAWLEDTSFLSPTVTTDAFNDALEVCKLNYAYIPHFGRWYYIKNIEYREGGIIAFELDVDVLYSYIDDIKESRQFISRNEFKEDKNINDDLYPIRNKSHVVNDTIGEIQQGNSIVLLTTGDTKEEE